MNCIKESRDQAIITSANLKNLFWKTTDESTKEQIMDSATAIDELISKITLDDLAARTDEFNQMSKFVKDTIIPKLDELQKQLQKFIAIDNQFQSALTDVVKLSTTITPLTIPI